LTNQSSPAQQDTDLDLEGKGVGTNWAGGSLSEAGILSRRIRNQSQDVEDVEGRCARGSSALLLAWCLCRPCRGDPRRCTLARAERAGFASRMAHHGTSSKAPPRALSDMEPQDTKAAAAAGLMDVFRDGVSSAAAQEHMRKIHERRCAVRRVLLDSRDQLLTTLDDAAGDARSLRLDPTIKALLENASSRLSHAFRDLLENKLPPMDAAEDEPRSALLYRVAQLRDEVRIHRVRLGRNRRQFSALAEAYRRLRRSQADARGRIEQFIVSLQGTTLLHQSTISHAGSMSTTGGAASPLATAASFGPLVRNPAASGFAAGMAAIFGLGTSSVSPDDGRVSVAGLLGPGKMFERSDLTPTGWMLSSDESGDNDSSLLELQDSLAGLPLFEPNEVDGIVADALKRAALVHEGQLKALQAKHDEYVAGEQLRLEEVARKAVAEWHDERRLVKAVQRQYEAQLDSLRRSLDAAEALATNQILAARAAKDRHIIEVQARLECANLNHDDLLEKYADLRVELAFAADDAVEQRKALLDLHASSQKLEHDLKLKIADLVSRLESVEDPEVIAARTSAPYKLQLKYLNEAISRLEDEKKAAHAMLAATESELAVTRSERHAALEQAQAEEQRALAAFEDRAKAAGAQKDLAAQLERVQAEAAASRGDLTVAEREATRWRDTATQLQAALAGLRDKHQTLLARGREDRSAGAGVQVDSGAATGRPHADGSPSLRYQPHQGAAAESAVGIEQPAALSFIGTAPGGRVNRSVGPCYGVTEEDDMAFEAVAIALRDRQISTDDDWQFAALWNAFRAYVATGARHVSSPFLRASARRHTAARQGLSAVVSTGPPAPRHVSETAAPEGASKAHSLVELAAAVDMAGAEAEAPTNSSPAADLLLGLSGFFDRPRHRDESSQSMAVATGLGGDEMDQCRAAPFRPAVQSTGAATAAELTPAAAAADSRATRPSAAAPRGSSVPPPPLPADSTPRGSSAHRRSVHFSPAREAGHACTGSATGVHGPASTPSQLNTVSTTHLEQSTPTTVHLATPDSTLDPSPRTFFGRGPGSGTASGDASPAGSGLTMSGSGSPSGLAKLLTSADRWRRHGGARSTATPPWSAACAPLPTPRGSSLGLATRSVGCQTPTGGTASLGTAPVAVAAGGPHHRTSSTQTDAADTDIYGLYPPPPRAIIAYSWWSGSATTTRPTSASTAVANFAGSVTNVLVPGSKRNEVMDVDAGTGYRPQPPLADRRRHHGRPGSASSSIAAVGSAADPPSSGLFRGGASIAKTHKVPIRQLSLLPESILNPQSPHLQTAATAAAIGSTGVTAVKRVTSKPPRAISASAQRPEGIRDPSSTPGATEAATNTLVGSALVTPRVVPRSSGAVYDAARDP
jgi:hypothetical protein